MKKSITYQTAEQFGLLGILPRKKRYGTAKDNKIVQDAIISNKEFCQYCMQVENAYYINQIIERLVRWVIWCNDIYYNGYNGTYTY